MWNWQCWQCEVGNLGNLDFVTGFTSGPVARPAVARGRRGAYDSAMRHDDDIAFQRAILADPADTTLKLVYADWLQDRDDPRAEFVRAQVEDRPPPNGGLDPAWVAFMTTLALPFEPVTFRQGNPAYVFTEMVGRRGRVAAFESQFCAADAWDEGLLADLAFLTGVEWGRCPYAKLPCDIGGFVCELPDASDPLTAREALAALKVADFRGRGIETFDAIDLLHTGYVPGAANDQIHSDPIRQNMFETRPEGAERTGAHGALKRHVTGRRLWYVLLRQTRAAFTRVTLFTVGRSPYGHRLVGAMLGDASQNW
jgi:uncharacterized protein (TIGR02996 family)